MHTLRTNNETCAVISEDNKYTCYIDMRNERIYASHYEHHFIINKNPTDTVIVVSENGQTWLTFTVLNGTLHIVSSTL